MKIRTDFVTNSSSYCTTEVIIDNLVLLEILQKYKDMGLFGNNDPIIGIGTYESVDGQFSEAQYEGRTKTPAFFYFEAQNDEGIEALFLVNWIIPQSLDDILEKIISIIDSGDKYLDTEVVSQLKEELNQRQDEINQAYSEVYWRSSGWWDDGESFEKFKYDPINGSSFLSKNGQNVNTTEIAIENPILLEILIEYKDMSLFGDREPIIGIGELTSIFDNWAEREHYELIEKPAFYYYEEELFYEDEYLALAPFCPTKLTDVVDGVTSIMEKGTAYLDGQVFSRLKEELTLRKAEINQAYSRVYWSCLNRSNGGKFEFDPINGETYTRVHWSDDMEEWVEGDEELDEDE